MVEKSNVNKIVLKFITKKTLLIIKNLNNNSGKKENIYDPNDPEIVFEGLILVNFLPPTNLPTTYPPISEKIQINKIHINI